MLGLLLGNLFLDHRIGIAENDPVVQFHDSGGVLVGQLRIVGDHDDQAVLGHLLEEVHDLDRGLGVQCPGGLVGQEDAGVVHQGTGYGNPLHLAAGELVGSLVDMLAQAYLLQGLDCPGMAFLAGYPGNGQGQLHVREDGLVGNQVIALEYETNRVVTVGVPVPVLVLLGGCPVDDQVSAVVPVQAADDVQQSGLA